MSAHAEVTARRGAGERGAEPLRVRPPSPLPPRRQAAVAVVAAAVALVGLVLVLDARAEDGGRARWSEGGELPVPRSATVDRFDRTEPLGPTEGFGAWQASNPSLQVDDGVLRSTGGPVTATVDAGSSDVLVHAQVAQVGRGAGLVLSASPDGQSGLWLVAAGGGDGWDLRWQRGVAAPQVIQSFPGPHFEVSVQVTRRGDRVRVLLDGLAYEVGVPPESAAGTFVGLTSAHPGNVVDLFGYLPLDAG